MKYQEIAKLGGMEKLSEEELYKKAIKLLNQELGAVEIKKWVWVINGFRIKNA